MAAYLSFNTQCQSQWREVVRDALNTIAQMRSNANLVPAYRNNLDNPEERTARGPAETHLNALRQTGCAPKD